MKLLRLILIAALLGFTFQNAVGQTYINPTFMGSGSNGAGVGLTYPTSSSNAVWAELVNSGTANYLAYYAATGNAVSAEQFLIAAQMPALTGDVTNTAGSVATTLAKIDGNPVSASSPSTNQVLQWNGSDWVAATVPINHRWIISFYENGTVTGIDTQTLVVAPYINGNTSDTWTPERCTLYVNIPTSSATTVQIIYSTTGNAAVGSGTGILNSNLSESGSSNYLVSTTTMAAVTVASGNYVACNWVACGGTNGIVTMEFDD